MQTATQTARAALAAGWIAAAVLVLGLGGWAATARIDGAILAQGQIVAGRTRLAVQHPEGGRVEHLLVAEGQAVAAGQPLLRLEAGLLEAERAIVADQYAAALARHARLIAERDGAAHLPPPDPAAAVLPGLAAHWAGQAALLEARRATLAHQLDLLAERRAQAAAQRAGLAAQLAALADERALLQDEIDRDAALAAAGLAPAARLAPQRREALRLDAARAAVAAELAAADGRLTEIDLQVLGLRAQRREEAEAALRETGPRLVELAARRGLIEARLEALTLRAPAAGRVHGLAVGGPGAVVRPAEPVAELVPAGPGGLALVQVRPEDIDRLAPGQTVRLMLPATGGREAPEFEGRIALISADAVEDPRSGARHFLVEVAFDPPTDGTPPPLPGQPVEARIRTGSRSPLAWVMAPLLRHLDRALRPD